MVTVEEQAIIPEPARIVVDQVDQNQPPEDDVVLVVG